MTNPNDDGSIAAGIEARYPRHRFDPSSPGSIYCRHCPAPVFANVHDSSKPYEGVRGSD